MSEKFECWKDRSLLLRLSNSGTRAVNWKILSLIWRKCYLGNLKPFGIWLSEQILSWCVPLLPQYIDEPKMEDFLRILVKDLIDSNATWVLWGTEFWGRRFQGYAKVGYDHCQSDYLEELDHLDQSDYDRNLDVLDGCSCILYFVSIHDSAIMAL